MKDSCLFSKHLPSISYIPAARETSVNKQTKKFLPPHFMKFTFQLGIQDIQQLNRKLKLLIVLSATKEAQKTEMEADEKLGGALKCRGQGSLPEVI